jgi:hypothetical protein
VTCARSFRACASCFSYSRIEAEISSRFRRSVVTVRISGIGGIRSGQDRSRRGMARFGQGRSAFAKPFAEPMMTVTALSPECFDVDQWSLRRKIGAEAPTEKP